jgi:predicted O-methyltransferase YrrM
MSYVQAPQKEKEAQDILLRNLQRTVDSLPSTGDFSGKKILGSPTPAPAAQPQKPVQLPKVAVESVNNFLRTWTEEKIPVTEGQTVPAQIEAFIKFLTENTGVKTILEIGFNAGLSSGVFLAVRPDIKVISVDIGQHEYILAAQKLISRVFPGRHQLIVGDSADVLPQLLDTLKTLPDLIFLDGAHTEPVVSQDVTNCLALMKPGSWILIDDVHLKNQQYQPEVRAAVLQAVQQKRLVILEHFEGQMREHVVCKKIF